MDDLDYETHLEEYKRLFGYYVDSPADKTEILKHATKQAQYVHFLAVFNPLRDCFLKAPVIASQLKNKNARYYMLYGASRRLSMIFSAYQTINQLVHPDRTQPLSHNEQMDLSRDINVLYMNLMGILDNYAWCFMYERTPELEKAIHPSDIGLFSKRFRNKCTAFVDIKDEMLIHDKWEKDVKGRRDPVAHRVPLYVPHTLVTQAEASRYNDLNALHQEKVRTVDLEGAHEAFEEIHRIGTFHPYFVHHPSEPIIPIYPTIPTDMAHLVKISAVIEQGLKLQS